MLITFSAGTGFAQYKFYVDSINIEPGQTDTIHFVLTNTTDVYGFQAKVTLSDGLEFVKDDKGKPKVTLDESRTEGGEYQFITNLKNGVLNIGAFSASYPQKPINGNDGTIVTLEVKASDDFDGGYVTLSDVRLVNEKDEDEKLKDKAYFIGVLPISVSLNESLIILNTNETDTLKATINPDYATVKTLTWKSLNPDCATVSEDGIVTAIRRGNTQIEVSTVNDKRAVCKVIVGQPALSIDITPSSLTMKVGETIPLSAEVFPEDANDRSVTWVSNNTDVATVDENTGLVTAINLGDVEIIATANGGKDVSATCNVSVVPTLAENVIVLPEEVELQVGYSSKLEATVYPETTTEKTINWSSSDDSIATVDAYGTVTAIKLGEAVIYATCTDGSEVSGSSIVRVVPTPATGITISNTEMDLFVGDERVLTASIQPSNATDQTMYWESSDETIVSVTQNGEITALYPGKAVIKVSAQGFEGICNVTVHQIFVDSIAVIPEELNMIFGDPVFKLETEIYPENATFKTVTWSSTDENVARVSENGEVEAMGGGTATIIATSNNGKTATCLVNVTVIATDITLDRTEAEMKVGERILLTATVNPENASDKTITWSSTDESVATVDKDGNVTAIALGEVIITATCGEVTADCKVRVVPTPVTSISLTNSELRMTEGEETDLLAIVRPSDATDQRVTWTITGSDDEEKVISLTVIDGDDIGGELVEGEPADSKVIVKALKGGTAKITVTSVSSPDVKAECDVIVTPLFISVDEVTITNRSPLIMAENDLAQLTTRILPEEASDKSLTWTSKDPTIATVSETGEVTAISAGSTSILASSPYGPWASCDVYVVRLTLSQSELLLREGHDADILPLFRPADVPELELIWTSSDESVATVEVRDGKVMIDAHKSGNAVITATYATLPTVTATCNVTVIPDIVPVSEIILDRDILEMVEKDTYQLKATIIPDNATDTTVTWRSLDNSIATVSEDGTVTAVREGTTTIVASSSDGQSAYCEVIVKKGFVAVTGITLSNSELTMPEGFSTDLLALVRPSDATDQRVTWETSDESIVTFSIIEGEATGDDIFEGETADSKVMVNAIKSGTATITVTSVSNPEVKAQCIVTVFMPVIAVEDITLNKEALDMTVGDTETLIATVTPDNATDKTVTWSSANSSIASVSEDGLVTAISAGTTTVIASSSNGKQAVCLVTVNPGIVPVESITLSASDLLMRVGKTAELTAIVNPADATDPDVEWTSGDESIATISVEDGKVIVTALKEGVTTITAKALNYPSVTADCKVTVSIIAVESIKINDVVDNKLELEEGNSRALTATVLPEDATDKTVTWKSSNPEVVSVTADGVVTALKGGTATIYASSSNGLTDECVITVPVPVKSITLSQSELLMREGFNSELIAIVNPENATDKRVIWESSDPEVAEVDQNGVVTAMLRDIVSANHTGTAVITVTSVSNPDIKAQCIVTVVPPIIAVEDISLNKEAIEMTVGDSETLIATVTPDDATDKTVTWSSANAAIATVSEDGLVTAISTGTTTIIASSSNGKQAVCLVTVNPGIVPVESITLSASDLLLRVGKTAELTAIVNPADATDQEVVWTSNDESIATISVEDGKVMVTALKEGVTTITVTSVKYPSVSAECKVTVETAIIAVEDITLNKDTLDMTVGDTETLIATVTPDNATDKTVTWSSANSSIASVSEDGLVTAISAGTTTVIASSSNGKQAVCLVTVNPGIVPVESITLSASDLLMRVGKTAELTAIVNPADATDPDVEWTSGDESIATISVEDGKVIVTALKEGVTTITAKALNYPSVTADCKVTVSIIAVESIKINDVVDNKLELEEGNSRALTATVLPEDATDKTVTWKSSNPEVVSVTADGVVTALKGGTATIYASSSNGLTDECVITVPVPVKSITLSQSELLMREGFNSELIAIVNPENATDKRVIWESSDPEVAEVDQNGVVTAMLRDIVSANHTGTAVITVTSVSNPDIKAQCIVTVVPPIIAVEDISLNKEAIEMTVGDSETLIATVTPDDATDKTVTWSSANAAIATVSEDGLVTAISTGTTTIIASSSNGKQAVCLVTVNPGIVPVESITLSASDLLLRVGKTAELTAIVNPADATDQEVVWTSNDESIATISVEDGKVMVTALKEGVTTITVTSVNYPSVSAECKVTVSIIPVETITINDIIGNKIDIAEGETMTLSATVLPEDATDKTVTWKSSNPDIATVTAEGVVTGVRGGSAIIYASASNGLTAECRVNVYGMSISNTELLIKEGRTADLIAIVRPDNVENNKVVWSSDNTDIATVDENGIVKAIKPGNAVITATCDPGVKLSATCTVTVIINAVEGIELDKNKIEIKEGDLENLKATITPSDASDKTVTWKSSDNSVVIVTADENDPFTAVVTAIGAGQAIIYASSSNGLTASCEVIIEKGEIPVEGIALSHYEMFLHEGMTAEIIPIITPTNATDQSVVWSSDNEEYATVDDNGIVTAIKIGKATISATTANGLAAECVVTVLPIMVEKITLRKLSQSEPSEEPLSLSMEKGDVEKLKAIISPENASDKTVTWKSSDNSVVTIIPESDDSSIGVVTAVAPGTAIIYASSSNGLTAECQVTVAAEPINITIENYPETMYVGESVQLTAKVEPISNTEYQVSWISSNPDVATIDENGYITALSLGEVIITAKYEDAEASCKITVIPIPVTGISLSNSTLTMRVGYTSELIGIIQPANATDQSMMWDSSDDSVVSLEILEGRAILSANKVGTATVTVRTSNGHTATCEVTVIPVIIPVTNISLDKTVLHMTERTTEQLTATIEPEDATDKSVTWISLDESVATVSPDGVVTAIMPGTTTVIASSSNGLQATCVVNVAITIFDDGILIYRVISDTTVEVIGAVDPNTERVNIKPEAVYTSPNLTKEFTVTTIGEDAFKNCDNLKKVVIFMETIPEIEGNPFPPSTTVYVADPEEYRKDPEWGEIPNTIKGYVTIEAPEENPTFTPNGTIQISSDIVIIDKPTYWTSSNEAIATVDNNGRITMHYVGHTVITATCDGYSDSFILPVYPARGDANWDGSINVADGVNIANYVVKKYYNLINWEPAPWGSPSSWTREYWDGFYDISSDINGQKGITVSDASEVISIILSQSYPASYPRLIKGLESSDEDADALIVGKTPIADVTGYSIPVVLDANEEYVALQADVTVNKASTLKDVKIGKGAGNHKLSTRRINNRTMRVVLFDLNNSKFETNEEAVFEVVVDGECAFDAEIEITNIVASDINSNAHILKMYHENDINDSEALTTDDISIRTIKDTLIIGNAKGKQISVFSLDGAVIKSLVAGSDIETIGLTRGVYLITVGNKTVKFAVK